MPRYLTAHILNIQPFEREGLIAFLRTKKLIYKSRIRDKYSSDDPTPNRLIFNMSRILSEAQCGTVMCIAGFVYYHQDGDGTEKTPYEARQYAECERSAALAPLYFPSLRGNCHINPVEWDGITLDEAKAVVRHFLRTGTVDWSKRFAK